MLRHAVVMLLHTCTAVHVVSGDERVAQRKPMDNCVLLPMQPGAPPKLRLARSQDKASSSEVSLCV